MSLTNYYSNYSITYDKYFTMLQNACIRHDKTLKQKPSSTARAVYQHVNELDEDSGTNGDEGGYVEEGFTPDVIATPSDVDLTMNDSRSLFQLWIHKCSTTTINFQLLSTVTRVRVTMYS